MSEIPQPVALKVHEDSRGRLFEFVRMLNDGQIFVCVTNSMSQRGGHYHTRKLERFLVVQGEAEIRLRKKGDNKVTRFYVRGDCPQVIDIPLNHVHDLMNVGKSDTILLVWANEIFDPADPDTYSELI